MISSKFSERPCLKISGREKQSLASTIHIYKHAHTDHTHMDTCVNAYTPKDSFKNKY